MLNGLLGKVTLPRRPCYTLILLAPTFGVARLGFGMGVVHGLPGPVIQVGLSGQARQGCAGPGLVDEHDPARVRAGLALGPVLPGLNYVGTLLFRGPEVLLS